MDDEGARRKSRGRRRRRRAVFGSLVVVAAVAAAVAIVVVGRGDDNDRATASLPDPAVVGNPTQALCGFPRLNQVTNDGVDPSTLTGVRSVVDNVITEPDGRLLTFRVRDGAAFVLEWDTRATYTITRYDLASGSPTATVPITLGWDGSSETFSVNQFEVDADGNLYVLDTLEKRRNLLKIAPNGERIWSVSIPSSEFTTGQLLDLYGMAMWDQEGRPVVGIQEGGRLVHRVAGDGQMLDPLLLDGAVTAQLPDGRLLIEATDDGPITSSDLWAVDASGATSLHVGATWEADASFGVPRVPWLRPTGITAAPEGGLLVAESDVGFQWWGDDGVFRGVWPDQRTDLDQPFELWERTPVLAYGGSYYVLTRAADNGLGLTEISQDRMRYQLGAPVLYNAANESLFGGLGLGAGLVTDRPYNSFPDGVSPSVTATFDDAWAAAANAYRLRYQIRGDPQLWDPVVGQETTVDLPTDGGNIALALPPTRPGVYEVDAALIDRRSGGAVSGTCLRYTVAAPGSALDPSTLADGADWGGAAPLRGVQLASQLGVGSHRVQLDFGAIVPDPGITPDPAALDWSSLPGDPNDGEGSDSGSIEAANPFAGLAAAAELADRTGVRLIVQLGSGGDAERAAVAAGTWEGWVREIVAEFRRQVPTLRYWEPWNEPNNTGFDDGGVYERQVAAPFAQGARSAFAEVVIVGGNTLGIDAAWWSQLVAAGGCSSMDVVGIHPYTGYNRSWEEEGFSNDGDGLDRLRGAIAACGPVDIWDTESGWWSDGIANFWAAGSDVVRKLLWYGHEDIDEWTYFFSEGGFGETGNSWSLMQYGRYVKPSGAAFAASARVLREYGAPEPIDTGTPGTFAMLAPAAQGSDGSLLALWSDDLTTTLRVSAGQAAATVRARDVYGAERDLTIPAGGLDLPINGSPILLFEQGGTDLSVRPVEAFGPDVLEGRPVAATSTREDGPGPQVVTSGTFDVREPWRSGRLTDGAVDQQPTVEVTLENPVTINRIAVATAGIRCCTAGLRDYTVSVRTADGNWHDVATQQDQFLDRVALFRFDPIDASAVRVTVPLSTERGVPVLSANYSGVVGGLHPEFIQLETESKWIAAISAIRAWAPVA